MGLLETRWEGTYEGHAVVVSRNEIGRGFKIEWDGEVIANRTWSWVGLGELEGTAKVAGEPVAVKATIRWAGFRELDGKCTVAVDGDEVALTHVK